MVVIYYFDDLGPVYLEYTSRELGNWSFWIDRSQFATEQCMIEPGRLEMVLQTKLYTTKPKINPQATEASGKLPR